MKKFIVVIVVVAVVGGGGYFWLHSRKSDPATVPAKAAEPVKAPAQVEAEAKVVPAQRASLSFAGSGLVAKVLVKEGERVKAGQVIATLVADRQQAAAAQAKAGVQQAQARLGEVSAAPRKEEIAAAQASVDAAEAQLAKLKEGATPAEIAQAQAAVVQAQAKLVTEQMRQPVAQPAVEAAKAELAAARAQLDRLHEGPTPAAIAQAEAQIKSAQAQLALKLAGASPEQIATAQAGIAAALPQVDQAQAALAETELRAPFDGTIAQLDLKPGQFVSPGMTAVELADLGTWQLETSDLTEVKVVKVSVGERVKIHFDALPDLELSGKVTEIKPMGEKKQGDVLYTVVITPDQQDAHLKWNMTATVIFQ